jgi:hypothetical protein
MRFVVAFSLIVLSWTGSAYAHLVVDGTTDDLTIEVRDERLSEIFKVLGAKFGLHVKSSLPLDAYRSGRFAGSLKSVMKALLEGYDFVTRQEGFNTEVIVLGRSKSAPALSPLSVKQGFDGFK